MNQLAGWALVAVCTNVAANDLYEGINRLRTGDTTCARPAALQPLVVKPQLEKAAAALARGRSAADSIKQTGYRATHWAYIRISGGGTRDRLLTILQDRYCSQLLDPASVDIGIYQDARQSWILLAAPIAPRLSESEEAAGHRILALVNKARAVPRNCGDSFFESAEPLHWNDLLARAARLHAEDMARHNQFSHAGSDGSNPAQRVTRLGYRYRAVAENIAAGLTTAEDTVAGWIRSPHHCANLMNRVFTEMGFAFSVNAASEMGVYWAQVLGRPR